MTELLEREALHHSRPDIVESLSKVGEAALLSLYETGALEILTPEESRELFRIVAERQIQLEEVS